MMERPEPDAGFLDLKLSPKLLLGLMIGGDTKANRVSAARIPLAAAYILKHYSHVTIKPDRLTMRDVIGIEARRWDKHLPAPDIDLLVNILWDKGYTLGQKLGPAKWKDPLSAKYARAADENRVLVISRPLSPMEELLGVAGAVLGQDFPLAVILTSDQTDEPPSDTIDMISPLDGDVICLPVSPTPQS